MFGYIKINKPELKVKEYEVYRGIYCSLCKALKKHFGVFSTLLLNYDLTFLALLTISNNIKTLSFKNARCPFNPSKKCNFCINADEQMKFSASVTIIMMYHKLKDNISDSTFFKRIFVYLLLPYAATKYKKAKKFYPDLAEQIEKNMNAQAETESTNTSEIDRAAHQSADALGKILSYNQQVNKDEFYQFGYLIGKWVYLTDAADDIEKDLKSKSFNVFVNKYQIKNISEYNEQVKQEVETQLHMNLGMAVEIYDELEQTSFSPIINNILIDGMYNTMSAILKGRKNNERSI